MKGCMEEWRRKRERDGGGVGEKQNTERSWHKKRKLTEMGERGAGLAVCVCVCVCVYVSLYGCKGFYIITCICVYMGSLCSML